MSGDDDRGLGTSWSDGVDVLEQEPSAARDGGGEPVCMRPESVRLQLVAEPAGGFGCAGGSGGLAMALAQQMNVTGKSK